MSVPNLLKLKTPKMRNVILSIQPQHVENIFGKQKTVEFRTVCFKLPVNKVYIYASSPVMRIVGHFKVSTIIEGTPEKVYRKCGKDGMATLFGLKVYFAKRNYGYGIIIEKLVKYKSPINPKTIIRDFTAPQNYRFIDEDLKIK